MIFDIGRETKGVVCTDATAAIGMAWRRGLGKTRHIEVHYLWVQERVRSGDFTLQKVKRTENPADLMTKHLSAPEIHKYMVKFGFAYRDGRAAVTPLAT